MMTGGEYGDKVETQIEILCGLGVSVANFLIPDTTQLKLASEGGLRPGLGLIPSTFPAIEVDKAIRDNLNSS